MSEEPQPSNRDSVVLLAVVVEGGLVVLAWAVGWPLGQPPLEHFSWNALDALWGALGAVPMLVLFLGMLRWPVGPLARIERFSREVLLPLLESCSVLDLFGISLLAGLGEEMLFRGVAQDALGRWLPLVPAVALASLLFGLLHAVTAAYAVLATVMGAYLGWLYLATGNLLTPVVTHGLYDFLALVYFLRGPQEQSAPTDNPDAAEPREDADEEDEGVL